MNNIKAIALTLNLLKSVNVSLWLNIKVAHYNCVKLDITRTEQNRTELGFGSWSLHVYTRVVVNLELILADEAFRY